MFDEVALHLVDEVVGSPAAARKVDEDLGHLIQIEVPEQALVDQFGLECLPELIVLQLH